MLGYPVKLTADGAGWLASFTDIPEALTSGATKEEALEMVRDALKTAMEFYLEDGRTVPLLSVAKRDQRTITIMLR